MTKQKLKAIAANVAFNQLLMKQNIHKKVNHLVYKIFEV